jgi:hypothetical protein
MWQKTKSVVRALLGFGGWVGLAYAPADIMGLPDAYPFLRGIAEMERESLLLWFSGALVIYLIWVEVGRPAWVWLTSGRGWVDSEEAGQVLFGYLGKNQGARDDLAENKERGHPFPFAEAMSVYLEDGINRGIIKAKGHEEHFFEYQEVPCGVRIKDGMMFGNAKDLKEHLAAILDGTDKTLIGLRLKKGSIEQYIKYLERDVIDRNRAQALKKKRG